MTEDNFITIPPEEMQAQFYKILLKHGFNEDKAKQCAEIFTSNSIDGVYTHAVNRFPRFIKYVKEGWTKPEAEPSIKNTFGAMEQWDGNLGAGPLNAVFATDRAMTLADKNGIACVAMSNTNHWMRGGYYGWQAAKKGFVFIAWTNTTANMPAWNAIDCRLGNNPIVFALPYKDEAIVLDMAMSQFSYGAMEMSAEKNEKLPVNGGYDANGNLTTDPAAILRSKRPLPIGYWKGAGLSLLLDILATVVSGGLSTHDITKQSAEFSVSQVFICIDIKKLKDYSLIASTVNNIIEDYHNSVLENDQNKIVYPGEQVLATRKRNLQNGIPVLKNVWEEIGEL